MSILTNNLTTFTSTITQKIGQEYQNFSAPFSERRALLVGGDTTLVFLAVLGALRLWTQMAQAFGGRPVEFSELLINNWYWFPILIGGWWVLAWFNDLYDVPSSTDKTANTVRLTLMGLLGLGIYLVVFFLAPPSTLPRLFFLFFLGLAISLTWLFRWAQAQLFGFLPLRHRVVIIGRGAKGRSIASVIEQATHLQYQVLGYVDDSLARPTGWAGEDLPVIGQAAFLPDLVQHLRIHEIVVAIEQPLNDDLFQRLVECQAKGVRVSWMADLYEQLYHKIPIEHIDPTWALHVMQGRPIFNRLELSFKRLLDLGLGLMGLLVFAIILPPVALAIRLDSPGSIFYRQTRCGRAGQSFTILKFRTMTTNAEGDGQARWATKHDARITRIGRWLRRTRLDEVPQILNILRGEMSLVGPRPERPEFVETLLQQVPFYRTRLMAKPGLTGWAQTHYDYGNTVQDALIKLQYDFYYLRHWSVWLDLYIIVRTVAVVLKLKGT
jgi:exopolysaccharide biosynthesis polyprenyl glycosylphosphotransferase